VNISGKTALGEDFAEGREGQSIRFSFFEGRALEFFTVTYLRAIVPTSPRPRL
jgi:hypothetical protein